MKKIIYPELQTAIIASSASLSWPVANLLDKKPKKLWKTASGSSATLTLTVDAGVQALAIFNTNATSAIINGVAVAMTQNRLWYEFGTTLAAGDITIVLSSPVATTLEAGVIRAGGLMTLENPNYDLSEQIIDFSIVTVLSSGSEHVRKRDMMRQYTATMMITRVVQWENIRTIYNYFGQDPMAMVLADVSDDQLWCGYFKLSPIRVAHSLLNDSFVEISIREAV